MIDPNELPDTLDGFERGLEVRTMLRATPRHFHVVAALSNVRDKNGRRIVHYWCDGNGFRCVIWTGATQFKTKPEAQKFLLEIRAAYQAKADEGARASKETATVRKLPAEKYLVKAVAWRKLHLDQVDALVARASDLQPPVGAEVLSPELWKPAQWKWLYTLKQLTFGKP